MIDITTVQPNIIPPEVIILQSRNQELLIENDALSQQTKILMVTVIAVLIIGGIIGCSLNYKKDEKTKKYN